MIQILSQYDIKTLCLFYTSVSLLRNQDRYTKRLIEGEKRSELEPPVKRAVQCEGSRCSEAEVSPILQPKLGLARDIDPQIGGNHIN